MNNEKREELLSRSCFLLFLVLHLNGRTTDSRKEYNKYQVLRIVPANLEQVEILKTIASEMNSKLDFWTSPSVANHHLDVMVNPDALTAFQEILEANIIPYTVMIQNVKELIPERLLPSSSYRLIRNAVPFSLLQYHRLSEIYHYLNSLEVLNPDLVETFTIGKSFEGQDLMVVKVGNNSHRNNHAIWIDGGFHAREWISPATSIYLLTKIIKEYTKDTFIRQVLNNIDFYFLHVANPDGYEFTWTNDRLWRKTRSNSSSSHHCELCHFCLGTDLNRNWDIQWSKIPANSSLHFPCSSSYSGPYPFSELETQAMASFLIQEKNRIKVYLSLHSYSQMWLIPYGYTEEKPKDYDDLLRVAEQGTEAIKKVHGTQYKVGRPGELLYDIFGGSLDWAKAVAGIKYAFILELRDTGRHGFLLPESQIIPTGQEVWEALKMVVSQVLKEQGNSASINI